MEKTSIYELVAKMRGYVVPLILRELGGNPDEIFGKYQALYDAGEYSAENDPFCDFCDTTPEENVCNDAWNEIKTEVYLRWFGRVTREDAVRTVQLLRLGCVGQISTTTLSILPGEALNDFAFCGLWNKAHPDEEPISVIDIVGYDNWM